MGKTGGRLVALFFRTARRRGDWQALPIRTYGQRQTRISFHKRQPQNFANVPPIRSRSPAALDHQIIPSRR